MNDGLGEIARHFLQDRIPLFFSMLLIILFYMPLDFFELRGWQPQIGLICVYYWAGKRPNIFGFVSAFGLGLLVDLCSTAPLGTNCMMLMILTFILGKVYHYIRPASFTVDWLFFALACVFYIFIKWLIFALYFNYLLDISVIVPNIFSTMMFYPLIAYLNGLIVIPLLASEKINE